MRNNPTITLMAATMLLLSVTACGDKPSSTNESPAHDMASDCPPATKSGLSAIQRAGGVEAMEKYSRWQTELPPKSCTGALAGLIPDLPAGYGLPPSVRPPIFTEQHVYLKYVQIPEANGDQALELINFAGQPQFEFEIVQLTDEQAATLKKWLADNPKSISEYPVDGRMFYAAGGGVWYLPGNKLSGGIGTILANNVLIKFSMPNIYSDKSVAEPVARLFHNMAEANGL